MTSEAVRQCRLDGAHPSANALAVVKRMLGGEGVTQPESGMTKRGWTKLLAVPGCEG